MIREVREGSVQRITLCREEKKNALSRDLLSALVASVAKASADREVRAIIVDAEGSVFASGGDLDEIASAVVASEGAEAVLKMGRELEVMMACPVPMLAAVSGDIYGGGCELLLQFDISIMESHTKLSFRHARMGLSPAWGGTARLLETVSPRVAAKLLYAAEPVTADAAAELGLVTESVSTGAALERARALVEQIAKADRDVVSAQKELLRSALQHARSSIAGVENGYFSSLWGGPAHRRALESFAASKRK